jgi:hypothetical protein
VRPSAGEQSLLEDTALLLQIGDVVQVQHVTAKPSHGFEKNLARVIVISPAVEFNSACFLVIQLGSRTRAGSSQITMLWLACPQETAAAGPPTRPALPEEAAAGPARSGDLHLDASGCWGAIPEAVMIAFRPAFGSVRQVPGAVVSGRSSTSGAATGCA